VCGAGHERRLQRQRVGSGGAHAWTPPVVRGAAGMEEMGSREGWTLNPGRSFCSSPWR
jgi:hypothetical protein